jgi:hypothetical protein
MAGAPVTWWLSGGEALDVFIGRNTRAHGDIDVSVRRADVGGLLAHVDDREWFYRRDARIHLPVDEVVRWRGDLPCVAPAVGDHAQARLSKSETFSPNRPGASSGRTGFALPV